MVILLTVLHVFVSIFMIAVVLLQSGKGAEMGASFGSGGSQSVFGAGGGTTFLSKMTTGAAIVFMLTSLSLAYLYGQPSSSSIMSKKASQSSTAASKQVQPTEMPQPATPDAKPLDSKASPVAPLEPAPKAK